MNYDWLGVQNAEKRNLQKNANFIGVGMILLVLFMQYTFTVVLLPFLLSGAVTPEDVQYDPFLGLGNTRFLLLYSMVYTFGMGVPMLLAALFFRPPVNPFRPHDKVSPGTVIASLLTGMAVCIVANFVASYLMSIFQMFGIKQPTSPQMLIDTPLSLVINIFVVAVLPALLEEMVFRGYVLQVLRPYGAGLAIVASSLLFSLMHGNVMQIPFAFIVGLALGFVVVKTNCIWVACGLHFLNNLMSVLLEYFTMHMEEMQAQRLIYIVFGAVALAGLVAFIISYAVHGALAKPMERSASPLTAGQRARVFFGSPAIIISIVVFALATLQSILTS